MSNIQFLISLDLLWLNQLKSGMDALDPCKHSESMDWIDWNQSRSKTIHLLKRKRIREGELLPRNHSTYWIVNHWNPFKLVDIVSVILAANLNWRIYHNYNPFKSVQLEAVRSISIIVRLWFEVLNWNWMYEWLDLPNLQSITLGNEAFLYSLSTIIESIDWILNEMIWIDLPSLQSITLDYAALYGRDSDSSCSLTMRSNNEMIRNEWM